MTDDTSYVNGSGHGADEILDLVDARDEVVGAVERRAFRSLPTGCYVRVVNAFLIDDRGRLWIPTRTIRKAFYPDSLDFSMGGFVSRGERYEDAFLREMDEELRMRPRVGEFYEVRYLQPTRHGVSAFMRVYAVPTCDEPDYNPDDFSTATWLAPDDLLRCIDEGTRAKGDLDKVVRLCFTAP